MCVHNDIIFGMKLLRNSHYEVLREVCKGKCPHLCSNAVCTLRWCRGVNLCEGVLLVMWSVYTECINPTALGIMNIGFVLSMGRSLYYVVTFSRCSKEMSMEME